MKYKEHFYVYIMSSSNNNALYIGNTTNLPQRVSQHKSGFFSNAHTKKYKICKLVYYEVFDDWENAALREKQLKHWRREYKNNIIEQGNPEWEDLIVG